MKRIGKDEVAIAPHKDSDRQTESQISGYAVNLLPPLTHHHSTGGGRGEQIGAVLRYKKSLALAFQAFDV